MISEAGMWMNCHVQADDSLRDDTNEAAGRRQPHALDSREDVCVLLMCSWGTASDIDTGPGRYAIEQTFFVRASCGNRIEVSGAAPGERRRRTERIRWTKNSGRRARPGP